MLVLVGGAPAAAPGSEPIQPIPLVSSVNAVRADLGRLLFNDPILSANGKVSCASCHDVRRGGSDGRRRSIGFDGQTTDVNAPTVLNAALGFRQFWNGRAETLEAQIEEVVRSPVEMGSRWDDVVARVAGEARYRSAFAAAYPLGVSKAGIVDAIASYERTLTTPNSRFDRYLRGDRSAITEAEKDGYALFKRSGCAACHQGVNVGGNMFQKLGAMREYFSPAGPRAGADAGRFAVTGVATDRHVFKVPGLRNVALTAPYLHDGSAATLEEAVDIMFRFQLGRIAPNQERDAIVLFLRTLTGDPAARP